MKISEMKEELSTLIKAKYPLIALETSEENRTIKIVKDIGEQNRRRVFTWSHTEGMRNDKGAPVGHDGTKPKYSAYEALIQLEKAPVEDASGHLYVLKDYHNFTKEIDVQRKLRDLFETLKDTSKVIIFISPVFKIPSDLQKNITTLDVPLPSATELEEILCLSISGLKNQEQAIKDEIKDKPEKSDEYKAVLRRINDKRNRLTKQIDEQKALIISSGLGLTCDEYENVIAKCVVQGNLNIKTILSEKKQIIKQSGILEYFDTTENSASIGGLKILKKHIASVSKRFSPKARDFGIDMPKGLLLLGVPGTGKSLTAKACANELQLPLLKLDMSQLVSKYYGESSNNMRMVWKLAKAISPCILWIDEIEKGLGTGSGGEMHEETGRLFGSFLTEMEESVGIYVVATCNDHVALKAELMSRFPKCFFVDVPNANELQEIVSIHLAKVHRNPANFDMKAIIEAANGFVGREVRNIIQESLASAFDEDKELTTEHVVEQFRKSVPITRQKEAVLKDMRAWAKINAINASEDLPVAVPVQTVKSGRFAESLDDIISG